MIYTYKCKNCKTVINLEKDIKDRNNLPECESCGKKMKKVFHTPTIIFKGKGFYKNE